MKTKITVAFIIISYLTINIYSSEDVNKLFNSALQHYNNKQYEKALDYFLKIKNDNNIDNFELNFNVGSCYFKLERYGEARFYFERGLLFNPFDKDLYFNLKVLYNILLKNPKSGEQEIMNQRIIFFLPKILLFSFFVALLLIVVIFLILFILIERFRKTVLVLLIGFFIFLIITTSLIFIQSYEYNKKIFVVTDKSANVYLNPTDDNSLIMSISVGSKGRIINDIGDFIKINTPDGSSGWIRKDKVISNK